MSMVGPARINTVRGLTKRDKCDTVLAMNDFLRDAQPGEHLTIKVDHPITSFVSVSSALAKRWLKHNTHNRPLSAQAVYEYRSDMEAGRFRLTGEPIQFSKTGVLLNGQNRLTALAQCTPPITLVINVIRGLDDESQFFMDLPKKRTTGQQLSLQGVKNSRNVAAMARLLIAWDEDLLFTENLLRRGISTPRVEEWVTKNAALVELFNDNLIMTTTRCGGTPAVASTAAVAALRIDPKAAISFFNLLRVRANLPFGSPILALDGRLRKVRADRVRLSQREELGYFIRAWNCWLRGQTLQKMQQPKGGWTKETFPVMLSERGPGFDHNQYFVGLDLAGFNG